MRTQSILEQEKKRFLRGQKINQSALRGFHPGLIPDTRWFPSLPGTAWRTLRVIPGPEELQQN